jgi:hypothetical protein
MRTLTETLRAARRTTPQQPRVRCLIRDKQPRLLHIGDEGPQDCQVDMCTADDGALVVVKLNTSGHVHSKRVTSPHSWGQDGDWDNAWTQVTTMAYAWHDTANDRSGDVCISNNDGTLRLFYISSGGDDIKCQESEDDGVTWGSAYYVKTTGYREDQWWLASSGNDDLWWTNTDHQRVRLRLYYESSWDHEKDYRSLEDCSAWLYFGGLSVIKVGNDAYIFAALWDDDPPDEGRIICLAYPAFNEEPNCGNFDPWKVMPAFRGNAYDGWAPLWPKVIACDTS